MADFPERGGDDVTRNGIKDTESGTVPVIYLWPNDIGSLLKDSASREIKSINSESG